MTRIDVWRDFRDEIIYVQAMSRATGARVLVEAPIDSRWERWSRTEAGMRGFLDGIRKNHGETLDWLLIGASTNPGHPTTITFDCLCDTTTYLKETI
ncbi:hypothetical protein Stalingrad_13 [Pseudomonas phage Stalingrad]|uniref:Uncharacterized protein n=1 Tax=Pseudomonas phage Stalingrad TaxID=2762287 RepID=A0A7G8LJ72_9CAUD|nr:hypothetical protein Stalingrad_13 [Pseudomonas phage Stalingrad]